MERTLKRKGLASITALALVLAVTPTAGFAAQATGSITVQVTNAQTGEVVPGVQVNLVDPETGEVVATGVTDDEGNVVFEDMPLGEYQISIVTGDDTAMAGPLVSLTPEATAVTEVVPVSSDLIAGMMEAGAAGLTGAQLAALLASIGVGAAGIGVAVNEAAEDETP